MLNVIEIKDFNAPELDIYARCTEARLLNKDHPEEGMFIAESPKVIGRALDAGYEPLSVLVEKKQMEENEETIQIMNRFDDTKVSIFTADFEVLTKLTGFKLTRGMLCRLQSDTHTVDPCIQIFCRLDRGQGSRIHLYRDLCCFIYLKDASKRCHNIHDLARQKYRRSASAYKYRSYNIVL